MSAPQPKSVPGRRPFARQARLYLFSAAMLALAVAVAVFAIVWYQYAVRQRATELSRQVAALAVGQAVGDETVPSAGTSPGSVRDRLFQVEAGLLGSVLFVTDANGNVSRATTTDPPDSLPIDRLRWADASGATAGVLRTAAGTRVLVVQAPVSANQRLVAVQSISDIRRAQAGILGIGALALLVAAVVTYVAGGILARRLTAPLVRLESGAESVAAGAYGTQVAEEGDDEVASLARSFNRMSTRVADAYAAEKAFVGDVSHEIRTPLTSIRGFAEAMLDGTVTDPAQQRRSLTIIRDEATRIGEVSATLLSLAELDGGAVEVAHEPVDTALVADALHGRFAATAADAEVTFEVALTSAVRPIGDTERLLQAASTLLANALAYTPAGGRVRVSDRVSDGRWVLAVDDSGPGIPADKRRQIFDRFSRLDDSRASDSGGAGLGLAICGRLVELMDGTLGVGESELGGAEFTIELPAAAGSA